MKFNFKKPKPGTGNILVVGQAKTGKTTLLKKIAHHSVLSGTRIVYFDIDKGAFVFSQLIEGKWLDLGDESREGSLAPVKVLTVKRLVEVLITLVEIEKGKISPNEKAELISSVEMVKSLGEKQQTISGLIPYIMNDGLKEIFKNYAGEDVFNAKTDRVNFDSARFLCLECKRVFESEKKSAIIISYLFARISSLADGKPIIIIFDDASLALNNKHTEGKMLTQINNMRKRNVSFIFAIHNISDISNRLKDTLLNHCGTRIYTPNSQLSTNKLIKESYQSMGLSDVQLDLIATGKPRKDYIIQTADGKCQVIDLMIKPGSVSQIVTGGSNINDIKLFEKLSREYGRDRAVKQYLQRKGGLNG